MILNLNLDPRILIIIILFVALTISIIVALIFISRMKEEGRLERSLNMVLFLVTLPRFKPEKDEEKNFIAISEQFFTGLSEITDKGFLKNFIYGQPYLVLEMAVSSNANEIVFYIAVPRKFSEILERQIHSFFPDAFYERVKDYNPFVSGGYTAASYVSLAKHYAMPVRTYQKMEVDPLSAFANSLSKLQEKGEGGAIQLLISPAKNWQKFSSEVIRQMQKGLEFSRAIKRAQGGVWETINEIFIKKKKEKEPKLLTPIQEEEIKIISEKAQKVGFAVNINLVASAQTKARAEEILSQIEKSFTQFSSPNLNSFKINRLSSKVAEDIIYDFSFRIFHIHSKMILNTEELASIYHFPTPYLETPKIRYLTFKKAPPPVTLPEEGVMLGINIYRGIETTVKMTRDDRRRHLYVIGQTGTGKTFLLQNMIRQDMENGDGCCFIDPHGEAIEYILGLVPKNRADDVVVFDPADLERPLALNFLEYDPAHPEQKTFITNELLVILDRLYNLKETGGPMFERYLRNTLGLLMDFPEKGFTLMEIPKIFADEDFRNNLLANCKDILVKEFWEKEALKVKGEGSLAELTPYITSKFGIFINNDYMRPIIGQSKSTLNFSDIINNKKILLINLSKGKIGDINSQLLGMIVVGKLTQAALARVDMPQEQRKDFYLYIDEFQNYTTPSISTILSEARKYRLCLNLAHQFIGQLPEDISKAVFGNVGSLALFRVGPEDAEFLTQFLKPVFSEYDLINLDNRNALVKLLVNGAVTQSFNITTTMTDIPSPDLEITSAIKQLSRLKFGRDKVIIEEEIRTRYKQSDN